MRVLLGRRRPERRCWAKSDSKHPAAVETAATKNAKPTCVGWGGESAQADLAYLVAANSFAEVVAKLNTDAPTESQTVPERQVVGRT